MDKRNRQVWITGIGLVSSLGEGAQCHWDKMTCDGASPVIDQERFAPHSVHPLPEMDWSKQIPRRGDQRQMENWQRLGTYTAGLALDDAGVKDNEELVSNMDLVVAAGGGERDIETDNSIMVDGEHHNDRDHLLLERLPSDLRPTLFLAQLSNLLAGNISIVHKVTGSSRTYMGEENAGVTVIENAVSRIMAGQSTHALVGGSYNAERQDLLLIQQLGQYLVENSSAPIAERQAQGGGMIPGSAGAFMVLEDAEFAKARGAKPYAQINSVASDLGPRETPQVYDRLNAMLNQLQDVDTVDGIISGATGVHDITTLELELLKSRYGNDAVVRAINTMVGSSIEANFPFSVALAALSIQKGKHFPPFETSENPSHNDPQSLLVTSFGYWKGEGACIVAKPTP